jgi:PAS domain S-box-containing protein
MRRLIRLAWAPIPVLLTAIVVLRLADLRGFHESRFLGIALNIVFSVAASLFVAYLVGRSFLVRCTAGLLLLGCGVVLWGLAGLVAIAVAGDDINVLITIHNSCVWLSALCHLAGVLLSLRPRRALSPAGLWLPAAYAHAAVALALIALSAHAGWLPTFFIQGQGGTLFRQFVLGSAVAMFGLTALLLVATSSRPLSPFAYWYSLALALIAVGLFGVMLESSVASPLGWTGRGTQFLGGAYMLIAALVSVRESRVWEVSLEAALRESQALVHAVVDGSPDLIYMKDLNGRVLMANPAACEALGRPAEEVIGKGAREFHSRDPEVGRAILENDRRIMESGAAETIEELGLKGRTYLSTKAPYRDATGKVIGLIGISYDITDRKQAEQALSRALLDAQQRCAETLALMTCTRAVLGDRDLVSAIRVVFNACRDLLGAKAGYVAVLTADGQNHQVLSLDPGGLSCTVDRSLPMPVRGFRAEVYRMGRSIYDNDFVGSPWATLLPAGHLRLENVLFAPLVIDGLVIGLLGLGNKPGGFTDHDATLAATFGELVAIALRNGRTLESLRELNATLESKVATRTAELERRARQLQKLTLELSQAEDRERKRIAEILHEDLQQHIAGAKFHLSMLSQRIRNDPSQQAIVDRVDEMLKEAIQKSRSLSHELSPAVLHMNDLGEVFRWLANRMKTKHGLAVHMDLRGEPTLQSEALTMFLFRAAQEMLFNVIKHTGAREAAIRVRRLTRYVCLSVLDRGCGFDPRQLKETSGFGLLGIRERVELLGGRMTIKSAKGQGSRVHIIVPDGKLGAQPN